MTESVPIAHGVDDYVEMRTLVKANDSDGLDKMIQEGRIFSVQWNKSATDRIGLSGGYAIRILEGARSGEDGWIPAGILR